MKKASTKGVSSRILFLSKVEPSAFFQTSSYEIHAEAVDPGTIENLHSKVLSIQQCKSQQHQKCLRFRPPLAPLLRNRLLFFLSVHPSMRVSLVREE